MVPVVATIVSSASRVAGRRGARTGSNLRAATVPTAHAHRVELLELIDDAPADAPAGILELRDCHTAMVEITAPELDPAARIIRVPLTKLRRSPDPLSWDRLASRL
jgi:hypothetical protein